MEGLLRRLFEEKNQNEWVFLSASLAYAASTLLYRITTALLKINNKLPFHSVYGYYRLYES